MKISNFFFSLICIVLFNPKSFAQKKHYLGISAGVSYQNQDWDYPASVNRETQFRTGLYLGLNNHSVFNKYLSWNSHIGYLQRGMREEWLVTSESNPTGNGETEWVDSRFDYLSSNMSIQVTWPYSPKFQVSLFAGPRFDAYIGYESEIDYGTIENNGINTYLFGAVYGLNQEFIFEKFKLRFELTAQPDFTKFASIENDQLGNTTVRNRGAVASLSFLYQLK